MTTAEPYYDPVSGLYIPGRTPACLPKCRLIHSIPDSYLNPCLHCGRLCNCVSTGESWPQIIVNTLEGEKLVVSSIVVAGSDLLRKIVKNKTNNAWAIRPPEWALSKKEWEFVETFQRLHLQQTDDHVGKLLDDRKRKSEVMDYWCYNRDNPEGFTPLRKTTYFEYQPWEEEMFGKMNQNDFHNMLRVKHTLQMKDLHMTMEKWMMIFRGVPNVADFGSGWYIDEMTVGAEEAGCRDLKGGRPHILWGHSIHKLRRTIRTRQFWRTRIWQRPHGVPHYYFRGW